MSKRKKSTQPSRRKYMPLTGSVRHASLRLSFEAVAASHLAVLHLARSSQLRPTHSAVTRRALLDYCRKLETMTSPEREREAAYVLTASKAHLPPDVDEIERALAALEVSGEGKPLPSLAGVLHGLDTGVAAHAVMEKVDAMLVAAHPRRFRHLKQP